jgi:hypothetical protein
VLVSEYQAIDMHCIVFHAKFYGGLLITVLRNKQRLKKNGGQKFTSSIVEIFLIFQPRHLKKGQALEKVSVFLDIFPVNRMDNPTSNLT